MSNPQPIRDPRVDDYLRVKGQIDSYVFLDHVGLVPHDGQRTFLDAYLEKVPPSEESRALGLTFDYRFSTLIAACGRRFGKSKIVSGLGGEELLYPNASVLIYSGFKENCKVIYRQIRDLIRKMGIEIAVDRNKEMELELINGARLSVASNETIESRLGNSISLLILDEAKLCRRDLYELYLEPQLLDYAPYSRTIMISSPQEGWLEEYYDRGQSSDPRFSDYFSISLPTSANPFISREYLARLKKRVPPDVWEQEYEGKFVSSAGKVFKEFSREQHVFDEDQFPDFWNWVRSGRYVVFQTIDSGYSHYFAGIYGLYQEEIDTIFLFGEYQLNRTVTSAHARNIKEYEEQIRFDVPMRYADPAASQQIADLAEEGLFYNKAQKNLRETINCTNTLLYQHSEVTRRPKLLIHHECHEALRQVGTVQWKEDAAQQTREQSGGSVKPFKPDLDRKTDWDMVDAVRYGLYSFTRNGRVSIFVMDSEVDDLAEEEDSFAAQMAAMGYVRA